MCAYVSVLQILNTVAKAHYMKFVYYLSYGNTNLATFQVKTSNYNNIANKNILTAFLTKETNPYPLDFKVWGSLTTLQSL